MTELRPDSYEETFRDVIKRLIPELGMKLAGAVCDFMEPATGQNKPFFPVATINVYSAADPRSPDYECGIWIPIKNDR